jgi:hypothetical protein
MQDMLEAAEAKLMRSAVKASLVADTSRPDSDAGEVTLRWCARAKLLSVLSIPDLDRKLLVTTKATRPFSLLSLHACTRLNTHPGQGTTCPPTQAVTALPTTRSVPSSSSIDPLKFETTTRNTRSASQAV